MGAVDKTKWESIGNTAYESGVPVNAVAEAVRGLARDRSVLVCEWRDTNHNWNGYEAFAEEQAKKIAAIDRRIDSLIATENKRQDNTKEDGDGE